MNDLVVGYGRKLVKVLFGVLLLLLLLLLLLNRSVHERVQPTKQKKSPNLPTRDTHTHTHTLK